ncbi:MAG: hypothetical protein IPL75_13260 [Acidobacteria bacterium]|nr:hypothetical protein [Acidobacteriota bacterium]
MVETLGIKVEVAEVHTIAALAGAALVLPFGSAARAHPVGGGVAGASVRRARHWRPPLRRRARAGTCCVPIIHPTRGRTSP